MLDIITELREIVIVGNIDLLSLIIAVLIYIASLVIKKIFTKYIFPGLHRFTAKTGNAWDDRVLDAFLHPLEWTIIITGIFLALNYLPLSLRVDASITVLYRSALIILITWGVYDIASIEFLFSEEFKSKYKIDKLLIPLLSRAVRVIVLVLAVLIIFQEWGYEIDGLIAGLGVGGLAFALAAKDALSNMFGGIVIITDKPFSIGDWIKTSSVEGTVEDISFRSTRIRAFDQSFITVPNSTLSNEAITNFTRMGKRRITFNLGVTYDTPVDKLEQCVGKIKEMLNNHPDIHPETIFVFFNEFNDSSLDIFLYFFTNTTNWEEFLRVREDVNFKIMAILEELDISVAFPSRSLYFENSQELKQYIIKEDGEE